jgi:hypothetical protein
MNVIITAEKAATNGDPDLHCFTFCISDGVNPVTQTITVRTARVLAKELANRTALDAMMRAIAAAQPSDYFALVGASYFKP